MAVQPTTLGEFVSISTDFDEADGKFPSLGKVIVTFEDTIFTWESLDVDEPTLESTLGFSYEWADACRILWEDYNGSLDDIPIKKFMGETFKLSSIEFLGGNRERL